MSKHARPLKMSRRDFLKTFGAAAGGIIGAATVPVWGSNARVRQNTGPPPRVDQVFKIGLLLPVSDLYPSLGENLIAGFNLYFDILGSKKTDFHIELITEKIGLGQSSAYAKARGLVQRDKVDLVVGVVGAEVAARLGPLFSKKQTPLIVCNAGAHIVSEADQNPYVFYSSLNHWQASWAAGSWAAQELGTTTVTASSFYDSGYDTLRVFQRGFESAGGEIARTVVTHTSPNDEDLATLMALVDQTRPDFVYAAYCGKPAVDFVTAYAASGLSNSVPLLGSSFMVEDYVLRELGTAALGIRSVASWASSLDNLANWRFANAYTKRTGRPPDPFAVLGYDTACLINQTLRAQDGESRQFEGLSDTLSIATLVSPRGAIRMNPQTHQSSGSLYLREVQRHGTQLRNVVTSELSQLDPLSDPIVAFITAQAGLKTGFLNAYLAA